MNARSIMWIAAIVALASCTAVDPEDPNAGAATAGCVEMAGVYPPDTVTLVGVERVDVPFTSWGCAGYDQDTFEENLPVLLVGPDRDMRVDVEIRDGAALDIRAVIVDEEVHLDADSDEEGASVSLPEGTESVFVRMCTADGRCANYEADVGS